MSSSDALDRANSLIKTGQNYLAVPILEDHIRQNPRDYRAWGLLALAQEDPGKKRQCLQRVLQLATDPRMTGWAKQKLAELDGPPSFDFFSEPSQPAAPAQPVSPPSPARSAPIPVSKSAPEAKKPDYLLLGGFATIAVLVVVIGVAVVSLLPNLQNRTGAQVAQQNPPTLPPTMTLRPSSTPLPTLTSVPSRTPRPTETEVPPPTETPTVGPTATLSPSTELVVEARALLNVWEVDQALTQLNRAIQLDPNNVSAYVWRSKTYAKMLDQNRSQKDLESARSLDENHIEVLLAQGDTALGESNYSRATQYYQKAAKQYPLDPRPHQGLGFVYEYQGNPEKAMKSYETMLELDTNNADAYNDIGILIYNQENYFKALEYFEKAYALDPRSSAIVINVANANKHLGDFTTAQQYYDEAVQIAPKASHVYLSRGHFYSLTGDYQKAANEFSKALNQRYGIEKSAYYYRGLAYANLQQYSRAVSDFTNAIEYNPNPCAYSNRCAAYVGLGSYSKAVEDCTIAINSGGSLNTLFSRARAYDGLGMREEALADYQIFVQYANPNSEAAIYAQERIIALSDQLAVCRAASGVASGQCGGGELASVTASELGAPLLFCH